MRKIIYHVLMLICLFSLLTITALAVDIEDGRIEKLDNGKEVQPLYTCPNHQWYFAGYHEGNNQHTYRCKTSGCTAYYVEDCYFRSFCGNYANVEEMPCEACNRGYVSIHNYAYYHLNSDADSKHKLTCINVNPHNGSICGRRIGSFVKCELNPVLIWRGFYTNHGHWLNQTCSECNYKYERGHYYPNGHPNYFSTSNDCKYCQMPAPYYMVFDLA